jgi:hypothetical protein
METVKKAREEYFNINWLSLNFEIPPTDIKAHPPPGMTIMHVSQLLDEVRSRIVHHLQFKWKGSDKSD